MHRESGTESPSKPSAGEGIAGDLEAVARAVSRPYDLVEQIRINRLTEALFGSTTEQRLGRFLIKGTLGSGGMGTVLEAHDETLDRKVALKLLHGGADDQRLLREAQALARLSHSNVVQVHEIGDIEGRMFIAMELVPGQTLRSWQQGPRTWRECLDVYMQAGRGLAAAHAQGLVHRDFKPANCILDQTGCAKVLDFGLARDVTVLSDVEFSSSDDEVGETDEERDMPCIDIRGAGSRESASVGSALMQELTRTGTVLGTIAYMAPEQLMGRTIDARGDQFSFCVALYEALYGVRPFLGTTVFGLLHEINQQQPAKPDPQLQRPAVPRWVREVVLRGLRVSPTERFPSMAALLDEFERIPRRRRLVRGAAAGLGALVVAMGAALVWPEPNLCEAVANAEVPAWTSDRRTAVREGILGTKLPFAPTVWEQVEVGLDAYAGDWQRARVDACHAVHDTRTITERTYDLELACLDGHMRRMSALTEQLTISDPRTVAKAAHAVRALPSSATCLDAEELHIHAAAVPEHLAELDLQVRAAVDDAWALYQAGRNPEGLEAIEGALEQAGILPPNSATRAHALLVRGLLHQSSRRMVEARRDLTEAIEIAEGARDVPLQLDILQPLVRLAAFERDGSAAQAWLAHARGKLPLIVDRTRRGLELRYAEAYAEHRTGNTTEAEAQLEQVIADYRRVDPDGSVWQVRAQKILGEIRYARNDVEGALSAYHAALDMARAVGAPREVAAVLHDIGLAETDRGNFSDARDHLTQAHELTVSILGEGTAVGINTRTALALACVREGDIDAALEEARAARRELTQASEVSPALRGQIMMMSGALSQSAGRCEDAIKFMDQAHEALSSMPEPDHLELAMVDSNRADCLSELGLHEEAIGGYQRALAVLTQRARGEDIRWVFPLLGLGRLEVKRGNAAGAIASLERALVIQSNGPSNPEILASIHWHLGRALVESDRDHDRGMALVTEGRSGFAALGRGFFVSEIDAWRSAR